MYVQLSALKEDMNWNLKAVDSITQCLQVSEPLNKPDKIEFDN